jgi:hypothetical protein
MIYEERCVRQYQARTKTLVNGDKLIPIHFGLYDLFSGTGWKDVSRFRVVKFKHKDTPPQLVQVSGIPLSREYREQLLAECI